VSATVELDREVALQLVEAHRPVKAPHPETNGRTYLVQCRACDRDRWQVWAPDDPEYACDIWPQVKHLVS
jgi:hypothetical protein